MDENRLGLLARPGEDALSEAQPLTDEQADFVREVYALLDQFRDGNSEKLSEIRMAREVRELRDSGQDAPNADANRRSPQLSTLNSTVDNMVADFSENLPEAVMIPETPERAGQADDMTDVVGWMLEHAGYRQEWTRAIEDATVTGTGVLHTYWSEDGEAEGRVVVECWRPEDFLPDPCTDDLQQARAVFKVSARPLSWFTEKYPDTVRYINADAESVLSWKNVESRTRWDDPLSALVEVWFRRYDAASKRYKIHMAKVAGGALLYDSREEFPDGVYAHGQYPFAVLRYRERPGTLYGTGMMYEFADTQRMINRYMRYQDVNARQCSKQRIIANRNAGLDMAQVTDYDADVLEADITDERALNWVQAKPLNTQVMNALQFLQETMKQDSGQNQFNRGEGGLGVRAASAISLLQESGGKISRMHLSRFMEAFKGLVEQVVALAGQFFDVPRVLMITGNEEFTQRREVPFEGRMLMPGGLFDRPAYSVRIQVVQSTPEKVNAWNEQLLQFDQNAGGKGEMLPTSTIVKAMKGVPNKPEMVRLFEENDMWRQKMMQLEQTVEQLTAENQQLNEGLQQTGAELEAQKQLLSRAAQQLGAGAPAQQAQAPTVQAEATGRPGAAPIQSA